MPEDSSVERLKKKLYARGDAPRLRDRRTLEEHEDRENVAQDWLQQQDMQASSDALTYDPERELAALRQGIVPGMTNDQAERAPAVLSDSRVRAAAVVNRAKRRTVSRVIRLIFIASFAFFLVAASIAAYIYMYGSNQVTCEKIKIDVSGPMSIPSGKELVLSVGVTNGNPVALQDAALLIKYPEGTRNPDSSTTALPTSREEIGVIEAGEHVRTTSRSILYGREQETKDVELTLEYKISDSNAAFTCAVTNSVLIATAPVSLSVDGLEEISSDQEVVLTATITSNSEEIVSDQRLVARYPFGFRFVRSTPEPTMGNNVWDIGDVGQGTRSTVVVYGVVSSPTTEERAVTFTLGSKDPEDSEQLSTVLQKIEHPLLITRPFLVLEHLVNKTYNPVVTVEANKQVSGKLAWKNTLDVTLHDVEIEAALPGNYINRQTVSVNQGYYRSVDDTMIWNSQTNAALREVPPGGKGDVSYLFFTQAPPTDTAVRDPSFEYSFVVRARRGDDAGQLQEVLVNQVQKEIKFVTALALKPRAVYSMGPFVNTGPHPPRADARTTYTVLWDFQNTFNDMKDVVVTATLPINVAWLGAVEPSGAPVTFNSLTRQVAWSPGTVPARSGMGGPTIATAFQIALVPSVTQIGDELPLVSKIVVRGVDSFTGDVIEQQVLDQTTRLVGDPMFPDVRTPVQP